MLGERLFPLIQVMVVVVVMAMLIMIMVMLILAPLQRQHANLAGKITGMLLEIDNAELLHMLESPAALQGKVEEAVTVLQAHHQA